MMRARLATVALAASLGLLSGCNGGLGHFRLLGRNKGACCTDGVPVDAHGGMPAPGPGIGDFGPPPPIAGGPGVPLLPAPTLAPAPGGTGTAPAPRLVPQPYQARPIPYTPPTQ